MAHIVSVPKREPCKHCGLPVFFAERFSIDGSFYHRKCLRCARCDSQLTPGSFYETEEDGVFCCETCPDEEKKIRLGNNNIEHLSELSPQGADEQRQSFNEKLAMFQSNGKGLLQKSLSDEEKSKSLKRLTELYSKNCTHDAKDVEQATNESNIDVQLDNPKMDDDAELSTFDSSDENDEIPPLPKTLPPSLKLVKVETSKPKLPPIPSKANVLNKLYGKIQTQISTEPSVVTTNGQTSHSKSYNSIFNEENQTGMISAPKIILQNEEKVNSIGNNLNTNNMPLDALNSFTNVTKENAEFIEASLYNDDSYQIIDKNNSNSIDNDDDDYEYSNVENGINTREANQLELKNLSKENECVSGKQEQEPEQKQEEDQEPEQVKQPQQQNICRNVCKENKSIDVNIDKYDTNKIGNITDIREENSLINDNDSQKMVRSRLSQFEALDQSSEKKQPSHHSTGLNEFYTLAENVSMPNEQIESTGDDNKIYDTDATKPIEQLNIEQDPDVELSLSIDVENTVNSNASTNAYSDKMLTTSDTNELDVKKPVPRQRATLNTCRVKDADYVTAANPPTPSKRKQKSTTSEGLTDEKPQPVENISYDFGSEHKRLPENSSSCIDNECEKDEKKYPNRSNPFSSDSEDENDEQNDGFEVNTKQKKSLNPFDSEDDEIEVLKKTTSKKLSTNHRISTNPFGSDSEEENDTKFSSAKRTPVPTPRKPINGSMVRTTPDASPRMYNTLHPKMRLQADDDLRGSNASLASPMNSIRTSSTLNRSSKIHGSMSSLASNTLRHRKGRAPDIPTSKMNISNSANSSPSHSVRATPLTRKKRAAPLPPKHQSLKGDTFALSNCLTPTSKFEDSLCSRHTISIESFVDLDQSFKFSPSDETNYISSSNDMSIASSEPSNFMSVDFNKSSEISSDQQNLNESSPRKVTEPSNAQRKLISVHESLLDDLASEGIAVVLDQEQINYRRKIIPEQVITPIKSESTDRQCEKMKENKESQNKNRQSQVVLPGSVLDESNHMYSPNKSSYGKWKRRKGPAPSLPIPPRKVIQMLPLQEIRHELEVIEVQQQGLEKQGITLEKMIRERCEGTEYENVPLSECKPNSKEVEDLILQLFELVNEKNELFRRQAELMYLRRQHRLEQEQADIEYEVRVLMAQPECNKTDTDKAREEALISRLVDVVKLRNAVIESLEMDRIREAEEDQSIKESLEIHSAKREEELCQQTPVKLSKKEKKKQKESKKLAKQKKIDADKDADESEISLSEKLKEKKKKKKFLF